MPLSPNAPPQAEAPRADASRSWQTGTSGFEATLEDPSKKQVAVDWVFDRVAARYDLGNDIMSAGMHTVWKRRLVDYARVEPHHRVLDVACGTGDVTAMLAARATAGEVIGTDINGSMVEVAKRKFPPGPRMRYVVADALALPFDTDSFDRVIVSYAGRGFPDWPAVAAELARVTRPGGEVWNLDFARPRPAWWDATVRGWMYVSGAALGLALNGDSLTYRYIPQSMARYRGQRWLEQVFRDVGLEARTIETRFVLMAYNQGIKPVV